MLRYASWITAILLAWGVSMTGVSAAPPEGKLHVFVGTYTGPNSEGIYHSVLDLKTGTLSKPVLAAKTKNPSFLAIHPTGKFLYAVGEVSDFEGQPTGAVTAFAIDNASGALQELNRSSSRGTGPCHIVIDKAGKNALVANYGGGSSSVLPIQADGKLKPATGFQQHKGTSVDPNRQEAPHAHSINLDAANNFAVVADLGLDQVLVYKFDPTTGMITPNAPPFTKVAAGAGPRHFAFHPHGKAAYVINELNSTLTAFAYDADKGTLTETQTLSTLPEGYKDASFTAEVVVHPSGNFVYGSNRGHDSLAIYKIDSTSGKLSLVGIQPTGGKTPRNFAIEPSGHYLIAGNQASDTATVFAIDQKTGELKQLGEPIAIPSPVCFRFLPQAK